MLEGFPDGGYLVKPAAGSRVASDSPQGIPGVDGRAGDQRTLYALSLTSIFSAFVLDRFVLAGSTVCFVLASLNYPEAIGLIFGRSAGDMEEITWEYLTKLGSNERDDGGLSMMLRMMRLDDLGLGQLLFP